MLEPRSAYIHVPFCSHRCGYCNFTLISGRDDLIEAYLDALEWELATTLNRPRRVDTIFLGGGTPTHLPPVQLQRLLKIVARWLELDRMGEYSCEANPLDCTEPRLALLREHGVNRLSLGGQSFSDRKLAMLERDHTGEELAAILTRSAQYFDNISLDLIFAAPGETMAEWQADVRRAQESPIRHLSTYGLTIERGSAFYGRMLKQELRELPSELQLEMYEHVMQVMHHRKWRHYEVSNFAEAGFQCRHNEAYWLGALWWGFGPGAASFSYLNERQQFVRAVNHRSTTAYLRRYRAGVSVIAEEDVLSLEDRVRERLVFGLRRLEGLPLQELDQLWSAPAQDLFEPYLSQYIQEGWLEQRQDGILRLTRAGLVISDSLWPNLLVGTAKS